MHLFTWNLKTTLGGVLMFPFVYIHMNAGSWFKTRSCAGLFKQSPNVWVTLSPKIWSHKCWSDKCHLSDKTYNCFICTSIKVSGCLGLVNWTQNYKSNLFDACFICTCHDDVIKWKHFPRYWPFVRGIHQSPVNSPNKGQWHGDLMFSLTCFWIKVWVNNREAGDLRPYRSHYDVIVMVVQITAYSQTDCFILSLTYCQLHPFRNIYSRFCSALIV